MGKSGLAFGFGHEVGTVNSISHRTLLAFIYAKEKELHAEGKHAVSA